MPDERNKTKTYEFSEDYFAANIGRWTELFTSYVGSVGTSYLEIGSFEGRSLTWMLDNVLTHPSARATAIDLMIKESWETRLRTNVERTGSASKVTILSGWSHVVLKNLPREHFDIIYIDGGHSAKAAIADAILAWELLKVGGIFVIDDYGWEPSRPVDKRPQIAVDAFITFYGEELEVLDRQYQVVIKKTLPSLFPHDVSFINREYVYAWRVRQVHRLTGEFPKDIAAAEESVRSTFLEGVFPGAELVPLDEREVEHVEIYLKAKRFGEQRPDVTRLGDDVQRTMSRFGIR